MKKISRRDFLKVTGLVSADRLRRLRKLHRSLHGLFCRRQRSRFRRSAGR